MTQRRHGDLRPNHHPSGNRGNHVITGFNSVVDDVESLFQLGDPPNYHPDKEASIAASARRAGLDPLEVIYDELLKDDGHAVLYRPSANRGG